MELSVAKLPHQHQQRKLVSALRNEVYPLLVILIVLWVGNFLYFSQFGFYEDDWYYMPSAFDVPLLNTLHLRATQMFFQGRPLQVTIQAVVACAGAALDSIPALYFITFLFAAAKAILGYFVLRLLFDRPLSSLASLLFVISPLTTVRQSLNLELTGAPACCFVFLAILLYVRGHRIPALGSAVLAVLTYEPLFFLFVSAPLFRKERLDRKAFWGLVRHAVLCAGVFAAYFAWRRYAGETRSANIPLGPGTLWRLGYFDMLYSVSSFKAYLYGAYVGMANLSLAAVLYAGVVLVPAAVFILRRDSGTGANQEERDRSQTITGIWLGGLLILLSFALALFQLDGATTWPLAGRDTRAAMGATFGSSLLVASAYMLLQEALTIRLARRAVTAGFLLVLSAEFAYSILIQEDYVSVWRHDVSLLNQAIMLTPDAGPDSTVIISAEQKSQSMFPGAERMPSIGYQRHGIEYGLNVLSQFAVPLPTVNFVVTDSWAKGLAFGADGRLHWRERIVADLSKPITPGKLIALKECLGGFLVRSEREIMVDGRAVGQRRDVPVSVSGWDPYLQRPLVEKVLGGLPWYVTATNTQGAKELGDAVDAPSNVLMDDPHFSRDTVVLEAEKFARGNAVANYDTFGQGIGVVVSGSALPSFAEYDLNIRPEGRYDLYIRYAAGEARPMTVTVNDRQVTSNACSKATGGWDPGRQRWQKAGSFSLKAGSNMLRLSRDSVFPAIDKIALRRSR